MLISTCLSVVVFVVSRFSKGLANLWPFAVNSFTHDEFLILEDVLNRVNERKKYGKIAQSEETTDDLIGCDMRQRIDDYCTEMKRKARK